MSTPMTASATSGAGTPASELRLLDAASTASSVIAGAGFWVGAGCGAWVPAGVEPGGTPVVAVGPGVDGEPPAGAGAGAAALLEQPPAARFWSASFSALG